MPRPMPRRTAEEYVLAIVGRTGDGKSTFCNLMANDFDESNPFSEGHSAESHTVFPDPFVFNLADGSKITIVDTPGLLDTNGVSQDEKNVRAIIQSLKRYPKVHGFCVVFNEQNDRFDSGMQTAIHEFVQAFGSSEFLRSVAFVFSRSKFNAAKARETTKEFYKLMLKKAGFEPKDGLRDVPFFQVDSHPEDTWQLLQDVDKNSFETMLSKTADWNAETLRRVRTYVTTNTPILTADWDPNIQLRSLAEKREAEAAMQKLEEEAKAHVAAMKVREEEAVLLKQLADKAALEVEASKKQLDESGKKLNEAEAKALEAKQNHAAELANQKKKFDEETEQRKKDMEEKVSRQVEAERRNLQIERNNGEQMRMMMALLAAQQNSGYGQCQQGFPSLQQSSGFGQFQPECPDDTPYRGMSEVMSDYGTRKATIAQPSSRTYPGTVLKGTFSSNGRQVMVGPRGGKYTINDNGNRVYLKKK